MLDMYFLVTFQSLCTRLVKAFAGISLASSGLRVSPPRSCDRLDDDHMTAEVHRRWRELVNRQN